jgi:catechol 2,3-dioxygenase-like lactoylglutathione lyase family enzyme
MPFPLRKAYMSVPSLNGIHESSLYVRDLDRAAAFYRGVFGFEEIGRDSVRHVFLRAGRDVLLLFDAVVTRRTNGVPPHGGEGELHVAFDVPKESLDSWRAHLEGVGVVIEAEIAWPGGGRSLYLRDPERNSIELVSRGTWGF